MIHGKPSFLCSNGLYPQKISYEAVLGWMVPFSISKM